MMRRRELRELPATLAKLVREEQVDLVLLPGDLFDGRRVYPETIDALCAALGSMKVPVVIAPGNHDYVDFHSPYLTANWPENVHIFTDFDLDAVHFPELGCVVHGYAFTTTHRTDDPVVGFSAPQDGCIHLLCAHGEVGLEGRYAPISPVSLGSSGAAYAALGHIHAGSGLIREGNTTWAYCGCPEGRGFDELGTKGVLLVDIEGDNVTARFGPLSRRQYRIETVDIACFDESLPAVVSEDLVRIVLTGESRRAPDLEELLERARPHFFYVELRDETTLSRDIWERAEEDSLTGLFLREMRRRLDQAAEDERPSILLATRFGLAALEGGEDICP